MQRPAFQFYTKDWTGNGKLRRCKAAHKGAWIDALCMLHDSDEYGILRCALAEIAQAIGHPAKLLRELHEKGVLKGADRGESIEAYIYKPRHAGKEGDPVVLIPAQEGPIWFSSRMVRDEYIRSKRGEGTRFGEPPKEPPKASPTQREGDGPSTASAAASSTSPSTAAGGHIAGSSSTNAPPSRAAAIAILLRNLEKDRGKAPRITSADPRVIAWAERGITDAQLREAHALAVADREHAGEAAAINAGFLDVFVAKLVNPPVGKSAVKESHEPRDLHAGVGKDGKF